MTECDQIKFNILKKSTDSITTAMPVQSEIMDSYGAVHAKAVLWFADTTAANLTHGGLTGQPQLISLQSGLVGDKSIKSFYASAEYENRKGLIHIIRTKVTDETGRLIADVTTNYKLNETILSRYCN